MMSRDSQKQDSNLVNLRLNAQFKTYKKTTFKIEFIDS